MNRLTGIGRCTCIPRGVNRRYVSQAVARDQAIAETTIVDIWRAGQRNATAEASAPEEAAIPPPPPALSSSLGTIKAFPPIEDPLLHNFARLIMKDGKLLRSQLHLSTMLSHLQLLTHSDPLPLVKKAITSLSPICRIVQQKQGGMKRVALPLPLEEKQRVRTAIKWLEKASEKHERNEKKFGKRLALEVLAVLDGSSEALKKKDDVHKAAVVARANVDKNARAASR